MLVERGKCCWRNITILNRIVLQLEDCLEGCFYGGGVVDGQDSCVSVVFD